ncbi:MAG: hypothetical protein MR357_00635 [Anaeroplasma sp.]|nr:hypothetical protein [Anaeroplasma sp.]
MVTIKNSDNKYGANDAIGVNIDKVILPMRGNISSKDFSKFNLVPPHHFAYNPRGSRKLGLGFNDTNETFIITFNDNVFKVKESASTILLDKYLFMYMSRKEFDRKAEYISWGSSTEVFDWNVFCEEDIYLPPYPIQEKYVAIYEGLLGNLHSYEKGLDDLKLVCDGYIENLRKHNEKCEIGKHIKLVDERNKDNVCSNVKSVSISKYFNDVGAKVNKNELRNYKIVKPNQISYVQTTGNEKCFAFAINNTEDDILVTSVNNVFETDDELDPYYLGLWFRRKEFDRYARFISWGSARETVSWEDLCEVKIPIPDIKVQRQIVACYNSMYSRKEYISKLKDMISNICPILIKGSIEEAQRS